MDNELCKIKLKAQKTYVLVILECLRLECSIDNKKLQFGEEKHQGLKIVREMNMPKTVGQGTNKPFQHKQLGYQKKNPMNVNIMFDV